jgi:hypothetical protein
LTSASAKGNQLQARKSCQVRDKDMKLFRLTESNVMNNENFNYNDESGTANNNLSSQGRIPSLAATADRQGCNNSYANLSNPNASSNARISSIKLTSGNQ